ncbi:MAG: 16S rRNA (guanine(527)-N(7))-methyltransferase RsmG [Myxococcota bacterium]
MSADPDAALARFADLVVRWGARTDLTSAQASTAPEEVLLLDARVLADPALVVEGARLVDVGAGAGAPAIPLAILRPDLEATLVEPRRRRVAFLRTAIGALALERRVRVVEGKVDPAQPAVPGMPFDVALSRATFAPERWLAVGGALAPRVLVMTAASEPPAPPAGWERVARRDYRVPSTGAPRAVSLYRARAPAAVGAPG